MALEARSLTRIVLVRGEERTLVRDVSFTVGPGRVVGLTGPPGAGKTAALRLLSGLDPRSSGTVVLDGVVAGARGWPSFRGRVVTVPQAIPPIPGTPRTTFAEARQFAVRRSTAPGTDLAAAAARLELSGEGLDRPWAALDASARRQALLVLAEALDPPWLVLDEPAAGLTRVERRTLARWVRRRAQAGTGFVVASTDEVLLAGIADHLLILYDGEVQAEGPPETLLPAALAEARRAWA